MLDSKYSGKRNANKADVGNTTLLWYQSFKVKIPLSFLILFIIMIISTAVIIELFGRPLIEKTIQNVIIQTGNQVVTELGQSITLAEALTHSLASSASVLETDSTLYKAIIPALMNITGQKSLIAGGGIWPEPYKFSSEFERRSFFYGRQPNGILRFYDDYNDPNGVGYFNEEWYVPAAILQTNHFFWSKSYMDPHSFEPMITCTVPIHKADGFYGVSTIDLKLDGIQTFMNQVSDITGGYAFAVDRNNKFITFPTRDLVKVYNYDNEGKRSEEFITAKEYSEIDSLFIPVSNALTEINSTIEEKVKKLPNYKPDIVDQIASQSYQIDKIAALQILSVYLDPLKDELEKSLVYTSFDAENDPIFHERVRVSIFIMPKTYWKIVFVTPERITNQTATSISNKILLSMTIFLLLTSFTAFLFSKKYIIQPIITMTKKIKKAKSEGDTSLNLNIAHSNEIGILADSFNELTTELCVVLESERKSQQLLQAILDNSPAIITIKDTNGCYRMINKQFKKIFDLNETFVIEKNDHQIFSDGEAIQFTDNDQIVIDTKQEMQGEEEHLHSGYIRTYMSLKFPITNDEQAVTSVCSILTDITKRKRIEESLKLSEARFREVFEKSSDAFCVMQDNYIVMVNPKFEELFGYPASEVTSKNFKVGKLVAFESLKVIRELQSKLEDEEPVSRQLNISGKTKSRENIELDTSISFIHWDQRQALLLIIRDVREQRKLIGQIQQMQKMESIGMLAGGVAHDFNNLLTAIDGYSEIIKIKLEKDNPVEVELDEIFKSTSRAAELTKQLLAFSRRQILSPKILNLNRIITEMEKMFHRLIGENIDLQTKIDSNLWNIKADPTQAEQIVLNLVVNARDAMPNGGILRIETSNIKIDSNTMEQFPDFELIEGDYVQISVIDYGSGMTEKVKKQIFEPFFTTKKAGKGTGLGLATVFGIVMQSGGQISMKSEVNKGSQFNIYFPRVDGKEDIPEKVDSENVNISGNEVVLLVEDDSAVRKMVTSTLKRLGYKVLITKNGDEALKLCQKRKIPFDLLLTDVVMPIMSGPELVGHIKELWPDVKMLLMSGYTEHSVSDQDIDISDMPFIEKPFKPHALVKMIRGILDE
jgi:PAS domain S-box-containing protein